MGETQFMELKDSPSLDHIDPTWAEGRDYQLVCGLDCQRNWRELTYSANSAKGVRFLPWRYCEDDVGVKPVEAGDLCQFFNPETEEWELTGFEGKRWWELSRRYDARHHNMTKISASEETQRGWKREGGRASKGMLYWNDGVKNKRAKECPGEGWTRGMVK